MRRSNALAYLIGAVAVVLPAAAATQTAEQSPSPLAGVWTLNRSLSEMPREIGFNIAWMPSPSGGPGQDAPPAGGRGRRGSGGGGNRGSAAPFSTPRESSEDAKRLQLLTGEARNPPVRLMVVDTPAAVTITNELGQSRSLHPDGKQESIEIQGVLVPTTSRRDGNRLIVVYHVEPDREIQYTYSYSASPSQLVVDVQFLEHGTGDKARRIYEPGVDTDTAAPRTTAGAPSAPPAAPSSTGAPAGGVPATGSAHEVFDSRPGAELKGLKSLGILVEDLSAQAVACGLNHDAIETALSRRLTEGGFSVRRNSDDDTYLYVNIMTTSMPNGTCVSRYDAFLYTHATANLSYRDQPVLVQVSLMHRGGIGSSAPVGHAAAVSRGLENYVDLFVTQIHDANK
jgi:hypothetical protein